MILFSHLDREYGSLYKSFFLLLSQDDLQEETTQGKFMSDSQQDVLNIVLGRLEHPGRVRVVGQASHGSNTSLETITPYQLVEIIGNLKEEWRREVEEENRRTMEIMKKELKEVIKIELSQMASQHSPPIDAPDLDILATRVSTKGSCAEAAENVVAEEPSAVDVTTMGLYIVGDNCSWLVALGKVFDSVGMIHK